MVSQVASLNAMMAVTVSPGRAVNASPCIGANFLWLLPATPGGGDSRLSSHCKYLRMVLLSGYSNKNCPERLTQADPYSTRELGDKASKSKIW